MASETSTEHRPISASFNYSKLQEKVQHIRKDLDTLTIRVDSLVEQLKTGLTVLLDEGSYVKRQQELQTFQQEAESLRRQLKAIQEELTAKEQDVKNLQQDKAQHQEEIEQLKSTVSELRDELKLKDKTINDMREQLNDLQSKYQDQAKELEDTKKRLTKVESMKSDVDDLKQFVDSIRYTSSTDHPDTDMTVTGKPATSSGDAEASLPRQGPHPPKPPVVRSPPSQQLQQKPHGTSSLPSHASQSPRQQPTEAVTPRQTQQPSRVGQSSFPGGSSPKPAGISYPPKGGSNQRPRDDKK